MAKRQEKNGGAPKTATPAAAQQPEQVPAWLQPFAAELGLIDRYLGGDKSVADQITVAFTARLAEGGDNIGNVDSMVNQLVVVHGLPTELYALVFSNEENAKYKKARGEQALTCAREAGTRFHRWNREEARRVLDAWVEKNPETVDRPTGVLGLLSGGSQPAVQKRFRLLFSWAYPKPKDETTAETAVVMDTAMERARLDSQLAELEVKLEAAVKAKKFADAATLEEQATKVREELAALDAGAEETVDETETKVMTEVPVEPTLEERITEAETERDAAATARNYAEAARIDTIVTQLREQLAAAQPAESAEEVAPATTTEATGINTVDDAEAFCLANMAGSKGLRRAHARWEKEEITDEAFVAKVRDLSSIGASAS